MEMTSPGSQAEQSRRAGFFLGCLGQNPCSETRHYSLPVMPGRGAQCHRILAVAFRALTPGREPC